MKNPRVCLLRFFFATLFLFVSCNKTDIAPTQNQEKSLSQLSIESHTPCLPPPEGIVAWWPGDGNANDIVGNHNGTNEGGVTFTTGMVGQAFGFDDNNRIVIPFSEEINPRTAITWETWTKLTANTTNPGRVYLIFNNNEGGDFLPTSALGVVHGIPFVEFGVKTGVSPSTYIQALAQTNILDDQFHHIAGTYDLIEAKIYVDGILENTIPFVGIRIESATDRDEDLWLGNTIGDVNGFLDEVTLYNRALTAAEIQAIFNAGSAGKCKFTPIIIDILPGTDPNLINCLNGNGLVPVAILTSPTFDAATINLSTVRFGHAGTEATEAHNKKHLQDVDHDGDQDLVLHFRFGQTGLGCSDTQAVLSCQTIGGQLLQGTGTFVATTN